MKTYITPMTGIETLSVSHVLCASGGGSGAKIIEFATGGGSEIPNTAD